MSIYGSWVTAVIAKNGTVSAEANLGRDYESMNIMIPTIDSANISLQVGIDPAGTGTRTYQALGDSNNYFAAGTGAVTTTFNLHGYQYVKVVASASQTTAAVTFYLRGYRE